MMAGESCVWGDEGQGPLRQLLQPQRVLTALLGAAAIAVMMRRSFRTAAGGAVRAAKSSAVLEIQAAAPAPQVSRAFLNTISVPGVSHQFVVAPMVNQSDLPFRMLCRRYGADLCYTPMFYSTKFATDAQYREQVLHTCAGDRPLAVQFAANDARVLLEAALHVQDHCDAVDINLGCPQNRAREGHYGSYLLDRPDWPRVREMVATLASHLRIPVFCKIRLLPSVEETIEFCLMLQEAGCALVAVHGRKRGSAKRRRHGPADLKAIARIKQALRIPVLTNGNVRRASDVWRNQRATLADGVMVAEAVLDNPSLFAGRDNDSPDAQLTLAREYLECCREYGRPPARWAADHVRYMCKQPLRYHCDLKEALKGVGEGEGVSEEGEWAKVGRIVRLLGLRTREGLVYKSGRLINRTERGSSSACSGSANDKNSHQLGSAGSKSFSSISGTSKNSSHWSELLWHARDKVAASAPSSSFKQHYQQSSSSSPPTPSPHINFPQLFD